MARSSNGGWNANGHHNNNRELAAFRAAYVHKRWKFLPPRPIVGDTHCPCCCSCCIVATLPPSWPHSSRPCCHPCCHHVARTLAAVALSLLLFWLIVICPQPLTLLLLLALSISAVDVDCWVVFCQHAADVLEFWNGRLTPTQNRAADTTQCCRHIGPTLLTLYRYYGFAVVDTLMFLLQ